MAVEKGETAPGFELPAAPGETVDVGRAIGGGPVVLLFFPLAFSSVCTREMCTVRDDWSRWSGLGARVFGITVDSPFVTREFRQEHDLPFPVLSDFNRAVAREYGVLYEEFYGLEGVPKRSAFVIDPDGRVTYAWVSEDADVEPDYAEVRRAVERARGSS